MSAHVPSQPTAVSQQANLALMSTLSIQDRSFFDELVQAYGNETYTFFLGLLGRKIKVDNQSFYHHQKRRRHSPVQVASHTGGAAAGADCVVTIAAGSHYASGTKSPLRVGEVYMISASGILGKVTAINTGTDSAHTATIKPQKSTDTFAPANNDWLLPMGVQNVGEASTAPSSLQPITDKIINYATEIREVYTITDKAAMEKIEFKDPSTGKYGFRYLGSSEADKRFINNTEFLTMFGDLVTNTGITSNGTTGTKGVIPQLVAGASDLSYTAGSMSMTNFEAVDRELTFNGADSEIQVLQDIYQNQEVDKFLFDKYNQGAILWDSVGGSALAAAKYGFRSLATQMFTYHFKRYAPFSPQWWAGVDPATDHVYKNYGLFIPQGFSRQPDGSKLPTICLRYMEVPGKGEIHVWETGALATVPTSDKMELNIHMQANYGVQVAAANQCVIFQA